MADVIDITKVDQRLKLAQRNNTSSYLTQLSVARSLISRASAILGNLGGQNEKVSWLLEECSDLLEPKRRSH